MLISHINKFSGEKAADNFVEDYLETTGNCGWSNKDRVQWFSWFLAGPAKTTWLHSMKTTDKASWEVIVRCLRESMESILIPDLSTIVAMSCSMNSLVLLKV